MCKCVCVCVCVCVSLSLSLYQLSDSSRLPTRDSRTHKMGCSVLRRGMGTPLGSCVFIFLTYAPTNDHKVIVFHAVMEVSVFARFSLTVRYADAVIRMAANATCEAENRIQ